MAYASQGGVSIAGCAGCVFGIMFLMVLLLILAMGLLTIAAIGYAIYRVTLWLVTPQPRLFGAAPMSRWTNAYEHALFLLEQRIGIATNTTPVRILGGVAVLTLTPLLVLNLMVPVFSPFILTILNLAGLGITVATARTLTQPYGWFRGNVMEGLNLDDPALDFPQDSLSLDDW